MVVLKSNRERRSALYIDTSDEEARVELIVGDVAIKSVVWSIGVGAGKEVLEKVGKIMKEGGVELSELERIAVHSGPGRRSSVLRAGVTVAVFLALVSEAELVAVDGNIGDELVSAVFTASSKSVVVPNYDGPGFDESRRRA